MKKTILVTSLVVLTALTATTTVLATENGDSSSENIAVVQAGSNASIKTHSEIENENEIEDDGTVRGGIHANSPMPSPIPVASSAPSTDNSATESPVPSTAPTATPVEQVSAGTNLQTFEKLQFGNKAAFEELVQAIMSFLKEVAGRK